MTKRIRMFDLGYNDGYAVVLEETNDNYVYYFKYYTSAIEFIGGILNSFAYAPYHLKIS